MLTLKDKEVPDVEKAKRRKYEDGMMKTEAKLSSVKKLFIIGLMPDAQESHANVKLMLEEININKIPNTISADLKLDLNLIGKQCAACTNPCIFCDCSSSSFGKEDKEPGKLLTIGDLKRYLQEFRDAGGDKDLAKEFQSVVNDILLDNDDSTYLIDVLNLPELHVLLGFVQKIIAFLEKLIGQKKVDAFLQSINVTRDKGRTGLDGNDSKQFLKGIDKIKKQMRGIRGERRLKVDLAIDSVKAFDEVISLIDK